MLGKMPVNVGVDDRSRIRGMNALQDLDLSTHPVDPDPEALDIERHAARRTQVVGCAHIPHT